MSNYNEVLISF